MGPRVWEGPEWARGFGKALSGPEGLERSSVGPRALWPLIWGLAPPPEQTISEIGTVTGKKDTISPLVLDPNWVYLQYDKPLTFSDRKEVPLPATSLSYVQLSALP